MDFQTTQEESTAAVLFAGTQTYVINTITGLQAGIKQLQQQVEELRNALKNRDLEISSLNAEITNLKEEHGLKDK